MSYNKQTWQTGDVITADKLNHMEDGIAGGGGGALVCEYLSDESRLDKTVGEIKTAVEAGKVIYLVGEYETGGDYKAFYSLEVYSDEFTASANVTFGSSTMQASASTLEALMDEYPYYGD